METFNEWIRYGSILMPYFKDQLISEFGITEEIYEDWKKGKYQPRPEMKEEIMEWAKKMTKK